MSGSMKSSIETMLEILQEKAQKGIVFDILNVYQRLTLDVITRTAFGIQTDVQTNTKSSTLRAAKLVFVTPYRDAMTFLGLSLPILRKFCMGVQDFISILLNKGQKPFIMLRRGIRKVMEMRRNNPKTKKNDLLQLMLDSSVAVSGDVDVSTLEAGNAELETAGSEGSVRMHFDHLHEIMFTNRYALEDVQYEDIHIPKGTLIQAPVYLMHHDPDFWSEPEIFDPERFSTKPNSEGITYLPFGVGPRNCLGMRFAQLEAKLALANMVYKFHIKLDEKHNDNLEILCRIRTLTPAKVRVKLEPRNEGN
ncbi:Cytochrome P450 3A11 [Araneus ventricosus]|uniref:Cytochrome P450 3A11 n=1 Tax=Araneus ventricosus TaxID=182803 RepID=A0A4Y2MIY5_ARAVE|nr:Cytochrome P450 3A11 [Araneus ventricosus]